MFQSMNGKVTRGLGNLSGMEWGIVGEVREGRKLDRYFSPHLSPSRGSRD
jgi:hypothetical protein